jgi:ketosteroid isomerase-like protein
MPAQNPQQRHQAWEGVQQRGRRCSRRALRTRRHGLSSARNPVTGRDAIREALVPFVALGGQIHMRTAAVIENGDLAVAYSDWSLTGGTDPDGNPVNMEARSTDVMRRQSDRSWLDAIDDPYSSG